MVHIMGKVHRVHIITHVFGHEQEKLIQLAIYRLLPRTYLPICSAWYPWDVFFVDLWAEQFPILLRLIAVVKSRSQKLCKCHSEVAKTWKVFSFLSIIESR